MFEFIEDEMPRDRLIRLLRHLADELETKPNVEFINYTENYRPEFICDSYFNGIPSGILTTYRDYSICLREKKRCAS